jgi:hypothetical protein
MGKMQKRKKRNTQQYTTMHRSAMKKQGINTGAARSTGEGDSAPFRARAIKGRHDSEAAHFYGILAGRAIKGRQPLEDKSDKF